MSSCEHGNEPSGSIKYWHILEGLNDWLLLKMDSAPWSKVPMIKTVRLQFTLNSSSHYRSPESKTAYRTALCEESAKIFIPTLSKQTELFLHNFPVF
jgi:hypothetical protein